MIYLIEIWLFLKFKFKNTAYSLNMTRIIIWCFESGKTLYLTKTPDKTLMFTGVRIGRLEKIF